MIGFRNQKNKTNNLLKVHYKISHVQFIIAQTNKEEEEEEPPPHPPYHPPKQVDFNP